MAKHKKKEKKEKTKEKDKQRKVGSRKDGTERQIGNTKPAKPPKVTTEPLRKSSHLAGPSTTPLDESPNISRLSAIKKPPTKPTSFKRASSGEAHIADRKANRRQPADIDGNESEDALPQPLMSTRTVQKAAEQDIFGDDEDGAHRDSKDDEMAVEDPIEADLASLPPKRAREALKNEQPQWSTGKGISSQTMKTNSQHKDLENTRPKASVRNGKRKRVEDSSSSDSDSETNSESSDSDSSSDSDESKTNTSSSSTSSSSGLELDSSDSDAHRKPSKISKRAMERHKEAPRWKKESDKTHKKKPHAKASTDVNEGWPKKAHYVSARETGSRTLSLKAQPRHLREVLKDAIRVAEGDLLFVDGFPSAIELDGYYKGVIKKCARERDYTEIARRSSKDSEFREAIAPVISNRMSRVRGDAKKLVAGSIQSTYSLPYDKEQCMRRVHELLDGLSYIYPVGANGKPERNKPYLNPLIVNTLRTHFFSSTRSSFAGRHGSRFTSSIDTDAERDNLEVPMPMLCIVATVIHAALSDWSSGTYRKTGWSADSHQSTYLTHIEFLETSIHEPDELKYHRLMSNLYKMVSTKNMVVSSSSRAKKARELVNLDEMEA